MYVKIDIFTEAIIEKYVMVVMVSIYILHQFNINLTKKYFTDGLFKLN